MVRHKTIWVCISTFVKQFCQKIVAIAVLYSLKTGSLTILNGSFKVTGAPSVKSNGFYCLSSEQIKVRYGLLMEYVSLVN